MKLNLTSLLLLLVVSGCGQSMPMPNTQAEIDLTAIALQYHQYCSDTGSAPSSVQAISNYRDPNANLAGNKAKSDAMKAALASQVYSVYWNYDVAADKSRNGETILAFHNDVPTKGGAVAFADGRTEMVTKEEFASAAKASEFTDQ